MLVEFSNPSNPDYEQKREAWRNCMTKLLGDYVSFDGNDPRIAEAAEKCAGLEPENTSYCFPEIISVYLAERHTNPCFHILESHYFKPGINKEPEYIFRGSYEPDLKGGRIVEAVTGVFKPIIARMTLKLYYNGTSPELVKEWNSESTLNSPKGLFYKLNIPKSINPILDEYEKRPVRCDVKIPPPEEICENGAAEIELSGFADEKGNPSKSFNRIVVSIYKGEILNGETSELGPDYKVFTVGEGSVKVRYRPPANKDDGYEWLRVYNSCEILPPEKVPMSGTLADKMIIDQKFPINCGFYKGEITVTKSWDYKKTSGQITSTYIGKQTVTFNGIFKPKKEIKEMMAGQPIKFYESASVTGSWTHNEDRYCEGPGCGNCKGLVYQEYGSGSLSPFTISMITIITYSFPTGKKGVADQLAQFGLANWYDISAPGENVPTQRRTTHATQYGCDWDNSTSTTNLIGVDLLRYKLEDINNLKGSVSWKSHMGTHGISVTNMPEALDGQKPFDPEKDGTDYTYTITWKLTIL